MNIYDEIKPLVDELYRRKKLSNQEIIDFLKTDRLGLLGVRNQLIRDGVALDDELIGLKRLPAPKKNVLQKLIHSVTSGSQADDRIDYNPTYDVFISYSHKDIALIDRLVKTLEALQRKLADEPLRIFLDRSELRVMHDWDTRIRLGLKNSTTMLVGLSPNYFNSDFCKLEWDRFIEHEPEKKLIRESTAPVYLMNHEPFNTDEIDNEWTRELKARQHIDLRQATQYGQKELLVLYEQLKKTLRRYRDQRTQQPTTNLPPMGVRLLARQELQHQIHDHVVIKPGPHAYVLQGSSGMGKSTLAQQYAHAHTQDFPGGCFLLAANVMGRTTDLFPAMADAFGLEMTDADRTDPNEVKRQVFGRLRNGQPTLFILDSLESFTGFSATDLRNNFPGAAQLCWLITTTQPEQEGKRAGFFTMSLASLSEEEGLVLLEKYCSFANAIQKERARELLRFVGLRPLNVVVLGAYFYVQQVKGFVPDYQRYLTDYQASPSFTTLFDSVYGLLDPLEQKILQVAALMPPEAVVLPWLFDYIRACYPQLLPQSVAEARTNWKLASQHLSGLGFLRPGTNAFLNEMEPTLQEVLTQQNNRLKLEEEYLFQFLEGRVNRLTTDWTYDPAMRWQLPIMAMYMKQTLVQRTRFNFNLISELIHTLCSLANYALAFELTSCLESNSRKISTLDLGYIYYLKALVCTKLARYPQATAANQQAESIGIRQQNQYLIAASYSQRAGIEERLGHYEQALYSNQQAILIEEALYPQKDHPHLASMYHQQAVIENRLGHYEQALGWNQQAILIYEALYPQKDHPHLASLYHQRAVTEDHLGHYEQALDWNQQAILIYEALYPRKDHPDLAGFYHQRAVIEERLGHYEQALNWIQQAILIYEALYPQKDHPHLATFYDYQAGIEDHLGHYEQALYWNQQAILIEEALYPQKDHPDLADSYHQRAVIEDRLGHYEQALDWNQQAILIYEALYPQKDHPHLAGLYHQRAVTEDHLGHYEQALGWNQQATTIYKALYPQKDHPDLATFYHQRAVIEDRLGHYEQALDWNQQAILIYEALYPQKDHPDLATFYHQRAGIEDRLGHYEQALGWNQQAILIYEALYPQKDHPNLATFYHQRAGIEDRLGHYKQALDWIQQAILIYEALYPQKDHPNLAGFYHQRAVIKDHLGHYKQALAWNQQAILIYEALYPQKDHPDLAISYDYQAVIEDHLGHYEQALGWNQQAILICEALYPQKDHPHLASLYYQRAEIEWHFTNRAEALKLIDRALAINATALPEDHPLARQVMSTRAEWLGKLFKGE